MNCTHNPCLTPINMVSNMRNSGVSKGYVLFYMSNVYKVSADTSEKEKAVGGIMTFNQAGWLVLGVGLSGLLFIGLAQFLPPFLALIIAAPPGTAMGLIFAFYKKGELPFCTYLMFLHKFNKKKKRLVNTLTYGKKFAKEDELFN